MLLRITHLLNEWESLAIQQFTTGITAKVKQIARRSHIMVHVKLEASSALQVNFLTKLTSSPISMS